MGCARYTPASMLPHTSALPARISRPVLPVPLLSVLLLSMALSTSCTVGSSNLPLVINEVHATPPEWVEIVNLSDQILPLRNVQITDSDLDGAPSVERTQLPDIGILPGEHFVIALGKVNADSELHSARECGIPNVQECAFAAFRVRAEEGESVHLFEGTRHIDTFEYAPRGAMLDETLCRIPDGTGLPRACESTPAEDNLPLSVSAAEL